MPYRAYQWLRHLPPSSSYLEGDIFSSSPFKALKMNPSVQWDQMVINSHNYILVKEVKVILFE